MSNFFALLKHEIILQNRAYAIIRYNVQFMIFGVICLIFASPATVNLKSFATSFVIIGLPLSIINASRSIIKSDIYDGSMELLLSSLESIKIAMMKYIALLISNILAFSISIPLIGLFCALYLEQIVSISIVSILLLIQISGLALLTSSIEGYFRTNTEIISLVILPLIIPGIVLSGLSLNQSSNEGFIWVLLGMDMIITPITIVLSSYLIRNIYNR